MDTDLDNLTIDSDQPLAVDKALKQDKLDRVGFARSVVAALTKLGPKTGYVVSVEGEWGSGKTSTLAMVEALLRQQKAPPLVVHFNPWLVGDRDALLRQFLSKLADAVKLTDHGKSAKKAAKEIKTYAKVFDAIKLIPGAEPWASLVKSVISSVGEATGDIAEHKSADIEAQKIRVEAALRNFPQPIVVFIDDMDRLFPLEVFEMIRIVKAVGDLPNVGYVLAWDAKYVQEALASASVPLSHTYLDKIVQIRMPIPALSGFARESLLNEALGKLPKEALIEYFPRSEQRIASLYHSGLRDLLVQPRDISRLFNVVNVMEPTLRGEVVFSDILGLAAIKVMAPAVFDLLQKNPRWFVGHLPNDSDHLILKSEALIESGKEARATAYQTTHRPKAVQKIVCHLFPKVAEVEKEWNGSPRIHEIDGGIGASSRLLVTLQLSLSADEVSMQMVKQFLLNAGSREFFPPTLTERNCTEFLDCLAETARSWRGEVEFDLDAACLSIARMVDQEPFVTRAQSHRLLSFSPVQTAVFTLDALIEAKNQAEGVEFSRTLVADIDALSVATVILVNNYGETHWEPSHRLYGLNDAEKPRLTKQWAANVLSTAQSGKLLNLCNPLSILWALARFAPETCPKVLEALREHDATLDSFATEFFRNSFDSHKGQSYAPPKNLDALAAYCSVEEMREHAKSRLNDPTLTGTARAAWQAFFEGRALYSDGTPAR